MISLVYGLTIFGEQWQSNFNPSYDISLSLKALPIYAFFSGLRGLIAYVISLAFTLVVGYWAAKSPRAEKIILPFLDIMQSIPVLGFLPALVLGLVALFPRTNVGLELAAILMIFTGQVWNMTFAFYSNRFWVHPRVLHVLRDAVVDCVDQVLLSYDRTSDVEMVVCY